MLQYPVLAIAGRFLRPLPIITLGAGLMAAGLAAIALATGMPALLGCIAVFALGAMLIQPVQQEITAEMAEPRSLGSYFGFSALALAFGGGLGNFAGGWLYDLAREWTLPALPWLVFGAAGSIVVVGLLALDRVRGHAQTAAGTAGQSATS